MDPLLTSLVEAEIYHILTPGSKMREAVRRMNWDTL